MVISTGAKQTGVAGKESEKNQKKNPNKYFSLSWPETHVCAGG